MMIGIHQVPEKSLCLCKMRLRGYPAVQLSFVNTLQLLVAVAVPVIFTVLYSDYNYTVSWIAMGFLHSYVLIIILAIAIGMITVYGMSIT